MSIRYCGKCARFTPLPEDTNEHERCPWCNRIVWESVARDCSMSKPITNDTFELARKAQGLKKTARAESHNPPAVDRYQYERDYWIAKYLELGRPKPIFDHSKRRKLSADTTVVIVEPISPEVGAMLASTMKKEKGVKIMHPMKFVETPVAIVAAVAPELFESEIVKCENSSVKASSLDVEPSFSPLESPISSATESEPPSCDFDDGIPWAEDVCEVVYVDLTAPVLREVAHALSTPNGARGAYRKWIQKLNAYSICEVWRWIEGMQTDSETCIRSRNGIVSELGAELLYRSRANELTEQVGTYSIIGAFKKSA